MSTRRRRKLKHSNSSFITDLKFLYPQTLHDVNSEKAKYPLYNITYGELTYDGLESVYREVLNVLQYKPHFYIDIGSGRGKTCLFMASKENIDECVGIELVQSRYDDSIKMQRELHIYPESEKVTFLNADFFEVSLKTIIYATPVFVWISNLCFGEELTNNIFKKLAKELPNGSIVCSSKPFTIDISLFKLERVSKHKMSWSNASDVHFYIFFE